MAIQLQEYNGKNNYNNKIEVDFIEKKVHFTPIKGESSNYTNYLATEFTISTILLFFFLGTGFIAYILSSIQMICDGTPFLFAVIGAIQFIVLPFLIAPLFKIPYLNKNYPIINAFLIMKLRSITSGRSCFEGYLNLELIENKRFVIDKFDNIMLHYKLEGDCAKYIKKIRILNTIINNPYQWKLIIEWTKTPKNGKMWIKYL